jgi:hypothetical protein
MTENPQFKLPLGLLVLDGFGTVLVGLALAKIYAGIDIVPNGLYLYDTAWSHVVIGGVMMLPLMWHMITNVRKQAEKKLIK